MSRERRLQISKEKMQIEVLVLNFQHISCHDGNNPTHALVYHGSLERTKPSLIDKSTHHVVGIGQILLERSVDLVGAKAGSDEGIARLISVRGQLGLEGGDQRRVGNGARKGPFDGSNRVGGSWGGAAR